MRRRVLNWASALAALLSVVIVIGWIRSYWTSTNVDWTSETKTTLLRVSWGFGGIMFVRVAADPTDNPPPLPRFAVLNRPTPPNFDALMEQFWQSADVHFRHFSFIYATRSSPGYKEYDLATPFWFALLLSLILPAVWVGRILRDRRRRRGGLCPACGYDLRGSEGVCPECGTPIAHPRGVAAPLQTAAAAPQSARP
jgi:hypothetical protein